MVSVPVHNPAPVPGPAGAGTGALGRELRMCPRRRPGLAIPLTSLGLGVAAAILLIGLATGAGTTAPGDLAFVGVLVGIFGGLGVLLLFLRQRAIKSRAAIRIYERGVVREDRGGRRTEVRFADVARLQARITVTAMSRIYAIVLLPNRGAGKRFVITSLWFDNIDDSLVAQLAELSGRPVEGL